MEITQPHRLFRAIEIYQSHRSGLYTLDTSLQGAYQRLRYFKTEQTIFALFLFIIYLFICSFINSFVLSFVYLFLFIFIYFYLFLFIFIYFYFFNFFPFIHPFVRLFVYLFTIFGATHFFRSGCFEARNQTSDVCSNCCSKITVK